MRVGLLADSHDRVPAIAEFAKLFAEAGVGLVLHAGDFCAPFSLRPIRDKNLTLAGVFGRNDGDHEGLRLEAARGMGTELYESPHSVEVETKRILVVHDIGEVNQRSLDEHAFVVTGFTHRHGIERSDSCVIINPGEACGWLTGVPSAAILDLETGAVEFLTLDALPG
ncbi:MAG: YfcE family phosphodiesterase [Gemmatimonadaceae bacterium]